MPCIVFILDTSGSMSAQTYTGFSMFEIAKNYIDAFIRQRSREGSRAAYDRYVLATTAERYPHNIKSSGKEMPAQVSEHIRRLVPCGSANVANSLTDAFKFIHVNRAQSAIDNYGWGRWVQNSEQVIFVLLTDVTGIAGIPNSYKLEFESPFLGSELTKEFYRWDQKLFICVLRLPATPVKTLALEFDLSVERLCSATGGRSFSIASHKQIVPSIEHLMAVLQAHTLGARFDCIEALPKDAVLMEEASRLRTKLQKSIETKPVTQILLKAAGGRPMACHWPIPEAFWPIKNMDTLTSRNAHPHIYLSTEATPSAVHNDVPFDKLEIEPSPVTEYVADLLAGRRDHCVQAFIMNSSSTPNHSYPFGCLKLMSTGNGVNLFLLPYNFPLIFYILDELKENRLLANPNWREKVDEYFASVPLYMFNITKKALQKFKLKPQGADETISLSTTYSSSLVNYLSRLKNQGKEEFDRISQTCSLLMQKELTRPLEPTIHVERITSRSGLMGMKRVELDEDQQMESLKIEEFEPNLSAPKFSANFMVPLTAMKIQPPALDSVYRNPLVQSTTDMIANLNKLQANCELIFDHRHVNVLESAKPGLNPRFHHLEEMHNLSISSMGNYDTYIKGRTELGMMPLRELEPPVRPQAFGNPYKVKNFGASGVDEVMDSQMAETTTRREKRGAEGGNDRIGGPPKRRRGPLGMEVFSRWRERQSVGSETTSVMSTESALEESNSWPSTSNGSKFINENGLEEEKDDDDDQFVGQKVDEIVDKMNSTPSTTTEEPRVNGRPAVVGSSMEKDEKMSTIRRKELSEGELRDRKLRIARIVRRASNAKAFDDILNTLSGSASDRQLLKFAIHESQRYKCRELTNRLEKRLAAEIAVAS